MPSGGAVHPISDEEGLWRIFAAISGEGRVDGETPPEIVVGFDQSDVPWLRAYSHLLIAIAQFPLAYDWEPAFEVTFPSIFPMPSSPYARLHASTSEFYRLFEEAARLPEDQREEFMEDQSERLRELAGATEFTGIADLIAFVHLNRWPLVESDRMRSVAGHLEAMIDLSRENWRRILAETDNRAEWVPNPDQTGVFPRLSVSADQVAGWQHFLDEFGAILQGRRLIPHWRFDEGINMGKLFDEPPEVFDIVMMIEGAAVLPYLEPGEFTTGDTWRQIMQVFRGDFFRYFIWFN